MQSPYKTANLSCRTILLFPILKVMAQVLIEENSGIIVVQNATEVDRVLIHGEIMVKNVKNGLKLEDIL